MVFSVMFRSAQVWQMRPFHSPSPSVEAAPNAPMQIEVDSVEVQANGQGAPSVPKRRPAVPPKKKRGR